MISLSLPWPPSQNTYWRHIIKKGRPVTLISKKGRVYGHTCFALLLQRFRVRPFLLSRLMVRVELSPPKSYGRRRWDIDNYSKVVFDVMTVNKIWRDDSQVDELHIHRMPNDKDGYVKITIEEIAGL